MRGHSVTDHRAHFETFADRAAEHRWRLRASNGRIVGDCAEGYASHRNVLRAINALFDAITAALLGDTRACFEIYTDKAGDHRWRLRAANGRIVADSAEGYASKRNVKRAISTFCDAAESARLGELRIEEVAN